MFASRRNRNRPTGLRKVHSDEEEGEEDEGSRGESPEAVGSASQSSTLLSINAEGDSMEAVTVMKSKQSRRLRRELKREKKGIKPESTGHSGDTSDDRSNGEAEHLAPAIKGHAFNTRRAQQQDWRLEGLDTEGDIAMLASETIEIEEEDDDDYGRVSAEKEVDQGMVAVDGGLFVVDTDGVDGEEHIGVTTVAEVAAKNFDEAPMGIGPVTVTRRSPGAAIYAGEDYEEIQVTDLDPAMVADPGVIDLARRKRQRQREKVRSSENAMAPAQVKKGEFATIDLDPSAHDAPMTDTDGGLGGHSTRGMLHRLEVERKREQLMEFGDEDDDTWADAQIKKVAGLQKLKEFQQKRADAALMVEKTSGEKMAEDLFAADPIPSLEEALDAVYRKIHSEKVHLIDFQGRHRKLETDRAESQRCLDRIESDSLEENEKLDVITDFRSYVEDLGSFHDAKYDQTDNALNLLDNIEKNVCRTHEERQLKALMTDYAQASEDDSEEARLAEARLKWLGSRRSEDGYITSDGEYSDIEENDDQTWQALAKDKKKFLKAAHLQIMGDVSDDFSSVRSICQEFQKVRTACPKLYKQAFLGASLEEAVAIPVRYQLLYWDPFNLSASDGEDVDDDDVEERHQPRIITTVDEVMDMEWFISLTDYCNPPGPLALDHAEMNAAVTADSLVVPHVVHECLFDRVRHFISNVWNISSMKHGKIVKDLLGLCVDFDETSASGSSPYKDVILTACEERIKRALEGLIVSHDQWMASTPSVRLRITRRMAKIFSCVSFVGTPFLPLATVHIDQLLIHGVLDRLGALNDADDAKEILERVLRAIPEHWLFQMTPEARDSLRGSLQAACKKFEVDISTHCGVECITRSA